MPESGCPNSLWWLWEIGKGNVFSWRVCQCYLAWLDTWFFNIHIFIPEHSKDLGNHGLPHVRPVCLAVRFCDHFAVVHFLGRTRLQIFKAFQCVGQRLPKIHLHSPGPKIKVVSQPSSGALLVLGSVAVCEWPAMTQRPRGRRRLDHDADHPQCLELTGWRFVWGHWYATTSMCYRLPFH